MALYEVTVISARCDDCGQLHQDENDLNDGWAETETDALANAQDDGWSLLDGDDILCPGCADHRARRAAYDL